MALVIGNKTCTTGLAKRCYDNLCAEWLAEMGYDLTAQSADAKEMWQLVCYSIAKGVVDEFEANAELDSAVATVETTGAYAGIQRDPATANNCLAPLIAKQIPVTGGIT